MKTRLTASKARSALTEQLERRLCLATATGAVSLFVSSGDTNSVLVYDGVTGAFKGTFASGGGLEEPEGIAFGPDGNLYVSSRSDEVLRYNGRTGAFIDVFASDNGLADPAGIAFGGPDNDLFVSSGTPDEGTGGNQVLRFDGRSGAFEAVVDPANTGGLDDPEGLTFGPDGLLYVLSAEAGEVLRYDPATNAFVDAFVSEAASGGLLDPTDLTFGTGGDLFVSSAETSEVKRYDGTTGAFEGNFITANLGGLEEAEGVIFGANGNLFVVSELGNAVLEFNGTTGAFVGDFVPDGSGAVGMPTFLTFGPTPLPGPFADVIDNPYLPLIPGTTDIYRGDDGEGTSIRVRVTVTDLKAEIMGVVTTMVREREYEDGVLIEDTRDYFAQDQAGNVWYFGEDTREIEDGEVVGTEGSWRAGVDGAVPGIIMKAQPAVGDEYQQEGAPGVAEDRARVLAFKQSAKVPFATFGDCLQTEEFNPLEPGSVDHKFYAPGIGLVKEQEVSGGSEVLRLAYVMLEPEAFADTIDNPFLPMIPGTTFIYRGDDGEGNSIRSRVTVTDETREIMGVTTTVVREREYENGDLIEDTRDFFAQDLAGNVWYFGEASREVEDGQVVSTEGSWEAGVDGAKPGLIMRAQPGIGDEYQQEGAPGVAEDRARVLAFGQSAKVPFGMFGDCLQIEEFNPLDPEGLEHKLYAPGIGLVMAQEVQGGSEVLRLAYILF